MATPRLGVRRFRRTLVITLLLALVIQQTSTSLADTGLPIGGTAVIAEAGGDNVRLRTGPGYGYSVVDYFPEGTVVDLLDGPISDGVGGSWYEVIAGGEYGFMVSDYLAADGGGGNNAVTTSEVNLRGGPSTSDDVILVLPPGTGISINGGQVNGFLPVTYGGTAGWAWSAYVDDGAGSPSETGSAVTTSTLNLRTGPGTANAVIDVMPAGATVTLLGETENGFLAVEYSGSSGWASSEYLSTSDASSETAWTTDSVNFRTGASLSSAILTVLPSGKKIEVTGASSSGFYPANAAGQTGWISADYLTFDGPPDDGGSGSGGAIAWPVSGGAWEITQGYNGSSHVNQSSTWQYHYSFDIARVDRSTAGETVYSPVSGTVRWLDPSTGGISIDLGNGYAVAFFHVTIDPSWRENETINQGDYVGYISGAGGAGFREFPHLHLTVWATDDGGNWSRQAVPFTGQSAINGVEYPDIGGSYQWSGTVFYP